MELILVFSVETEPMERSSVVEVFSVREIVWGIESGEGCGEVKLGVHFRVVLLPSVDTESSSFPYAVD